MNTEWNSTFENKPDKTGKYLVTLETGLYNEQTVTIAHYDIKHDHWSDEKGNLYPSHYKVIAWMYRPQAYNGESDLRSLNRRLSRMRMCQYIEKHLKDAILEDNSEQTDHERADYFAEQLRWLYEYLFEKYANNNVITRINSHGDIEFDWRDDENIAW